VTTPNLATSKSARFVGYALALVLITALAASLFVQPSSNYYVYRFVKALLTGHGLTFWTPDAPVGMDPVAPILVALLASVFHIDVPAAGWILAVLGAAIGGLCLCRLTGAWSIGFGYGVLIAVSPAPVPILTLAFALGALVALTAGRWGLSGLLAGLAILTLPIAILLALLILILAVRDRRTASYALPAALIPAFGLALLVGAGIRPVLPYPGPDPFLIGILGAFIILTLIGVVLFRHGRAIHSWIRDLSSKPALAVIVAWSAFAAAAAIGAGQFPGVLVIPGVLVTAWYALRRWFVVALIGTAVWGLVKPPIVSGGPVCPPASAPARSTLATGAGPEQEFRHEGPIIDLSGVIMPRPELDQAFFVKYAPDALFDAGTVTWSAFKTTYSGGDDPCVLHLRAVNFAPFDDHGVDVRLGRGDLHLSNVAIGNTLHPGDLARVRLDWDVVYLPLAPIDVKLDLVDVSYKDIVQVRDSIPASAWRVGRTPTYHVFSLPGGVAGGKVGLLLSVYYRAGTFVEGLKVAEVEVTSER